MIEDIGYHQFGTEIYHPFQGFETEFQGGSPGGKTPQADVQDTDVDNALCCNAPVRTSQAGHNDSYDT